MDRQEARLEGCRLGRARLKRERIVFRQVPYEIKVMMDLSHAVITEHATGRMACKQVGEAEVRGVLAAPEEVAPVRPGRVVVHGMMGAYLLRVFVDVDRQPAEVVTAYRTSKIDKYRSRP